MKRPLIGILMLALAFGVGLLLRWAIVPKPVREVPVAVQGTDERLALPSPTSQQAPRAPTVAIVPFPTTAPSEFRTVRGQKGFWRLVQTADGVWWFLSPTDQPTFISAVNSIQPPADTPDLNAWGLATMKRVRDLGFNTIGPGSHPIFHSLDIPSTRDLSIWTGGANASRKLYSSDWLSNAERAIRSQASILKDNPNLVGYFLDNEIDWSDAGVGPSVYFDNLLPSDQNRRQLISTIRVVWPTVESFNQAWGTSIKDFSELDAWPALPRTPGKSYAKLYNAWLAKVAQDYLQSVTSILRRHDPNHLILGVRFKSTSAPREVVAASRNFTDAQSINYDASDAKLDLEMFRMITEESRQPILVSGFDFQAVPDAKARADGYALMSGRLARTPYIVGSAWSGAIDDPLLAASIRATAPQLTSLHSSSITDSAVDVFRASFATKPVMEIPLLDPAPTLDGELSDWPATARVPEIRIAQTVGIERFALQRPTVYIGYTRDGLYLALEVFDSDIQSGDAPNYLAKDAVQFFLYTRPLASEQETYDEYSHHFFFVPQSAPQPDGVAAIVGRVHHAGDTLTDSLIPHPQIRRAIRILPDRYIAEIFIPAAALNGFDPATQPALAVELQIHDSPSAANYFWASPPPFSPEQRPKTWGTAYLKPGKSNP